VGWEASFAEQLRGLVAAHPNVVMWVFPEMHLIPSAYKTLEEKATPLDAPALAGLGPLARELGVWLVPGTVYERAEDGRVFNTALVFNAEGDRVATYRKIFPWRPVEMTDRGVDFEVFEMPGYGPVGISICYDIWFPEHTRHLAWAGAELVLNLVRTDAADREQELSIVRANAIMNQVWIASVNAAAPEGRGRSLVVDPNGMLQASSPDASEEVVTVVVDFDRVDEVRRYGTAGVTFPWLQYREGDPDVPLPLYNGRITFDSWAPSGGRKQDDQSHR
jgi:predicted amidohydrolase